MLDPNDLLYKPTPRFSHGGGVKATEQEVHLNPAEVHHLDALQGGPKYTSTGVRTYKPLGALFKNPHIQAMFHQHVAEHRATGGLIGRHQHALASNGRYGDTCKAIFPNHLVDVMNKAQGGATYNPWDGQPEYFMGGLFQSFGSKFAPMAGKLGSSMSNMFKSGASGARNVASALSRGAKNSAAALGRGATALKSKLPSASSIGRGVANVGSGVAQALPTALPAYLEDRRNEQMMRQMQQPAHPLMQAAEEPPAIPMRRQEEAPLEDYYAQPVSSVFAGGSSAHSALPIMKKSLMTPPPSPSSAVRRLGPSGPPAAAAGNTAFDNYDSDDEFFDDRGPAGGAVHYGRR